MAGVGGESEQWYSTVDGGLIVSADVITLLFEASDSPLNGALPVSFSALRSVVLYPNGADSGSIDFELAVTDIESGKVSERTLTIRVSAEDGLAEARIYVPELHQRVAGLNAVPSPNLDSALLEVERRPTPTSMRSKVRRNAVPGITSSAGASPRSARHAPTTIETRPPSTPRRPRRRWILVAAGSAAAGLIALMVPFTRTAGDEEVTAGPVTTTTFSTSPASSFTSSAPTSPSPVPDRTVPPSSTRSTTAAAPSTDALFVSTLTSLGVDYSSPAQAVSTAKTTCRTIANSPDPANAILAASEIAQRTGGYTRTEANDFVGLAVLVYCFEYNDYVRF
ncbi:DUF732 domain-containing protein [Rhodococcoides kroppenstedtii]|uniref:DUF732 domain-containing protein n=1 Tax=Rhodococcoides kroppenstedtii TaxID=293050 RepID=UPI003640F5BB